MKKLNLTLAVLIALAIGVLGLSPAKAQLDMQLDATGSFEVQGGPSCALNPHTYPAAVAGDSGQIWTRDCDNTTEESFVFPFNFPPGVTTSGGFVPVTIAHRADAAGGDGLTTTTVVYNLDIYCRDTPSLTTGPTTEEGVAPYDIDFLPGRSLWSASIKNTDVDSFLIKMFLVPFSAVGAAGGRCELQYNRLPAHASDDTPFDVGVEYAIIHFP